MKRLEAIFRGLAVWRRFYRPQLHEHRRSLLLVVVLNLLAIGFDILRPWPLKWIVDGALVTDDPPAHSPGFVIWTGGAAAILVVLLRTRSEYMAAMKATEIGHSVTRGLRNAIFRHLGRLSPAFHSRHKSGDLLVRLMGDVPMVRTMLVDSSIGLASRSLLIAGTIAVMFTVDPLLTTVVLGLLPVVAFAVRAIARQLTIAVRKQRSKEGHMADYLHEAIAANTLIQSLGRSDHVSRNFARNNRTAARAEMKAARLGARMSATVENLLGLALAAALVLGSFRVVQGHLKAGELLLILSYVRTLLKPIRSFSKQADKVAKGTACGDRILTILDQPVEVADAAGALPAPAAPGSLSFEEVSYTYPDGSRALVGVKAAFRRGELVAIFGRSGSGKSTMAALALRLFDPTRGRVVLDGRDLREYELQSLRDSFGLSLQESMLLGETIRENMRLGRPDASDEAILRACRKAAADEFLARLPDGLDTLLGASGVGLSGGERRRLCLARTLLRDAPVLIVDEPFVGLDRPAAEKVRATLSALASERIVLVITHETRHLDAFDRIVFLSDGRVAASGPHDELLERSADYAEITRSMAVLAT